MRFPIFSNAKFAYINFFLFSSSVFLLLYSNSVNCLNFSRRRKCLILSLSLSLSSSIIDVVKSCGENDGRSDARDSIIENCLNQKNASQLDRRVSARASWRAAPAASKENVSALFTYDSIRVRSIIARRFILIRGQETPVR